MDEHFTYKTADNRKLTLCFEDAIDNVKGVEIHLTGMPLLADEEHKVYYKTQLTRFVLDMIADQAIKEGRSVVHGVTPPQHIKEMRFDDFCNSIEFEYSAIEYLSIPGLSNDMSNNGFLVPIYFNLEVLNKYAQNPKYALNILSATYGSISSKDEWQISFGVNSQKQIIMWLGDIDKLPIKEQQYLLSENIPSSFDLHSDFYDAQIECQWSEGAIESKCLNLRSNLSERIRKQHGSDLYKLPEEITKTISDLQKPIFWEDRHVAPVVESLNRIFVESLNETFLKNYLTSAGIKDINGLRALKLMEKFIEHLSDATTARTTMSPFFVLYDYRINVCHLQSIATVTTKTQSINERLGLSKTNESHENIYEQLFKQIYESLTKISELITKNPPNQLTSESSE